MRFPRGQVATIDVQRLPACHYALSTLSPNGLWTVDVPIRLVRAELSVHQWGKAVTMSAPICSKLDMPFGINET